jgi:hypothetical protein
MKRGKDCRMVLRGLIAAGVAAGLGAGLTALAAAPAAAQAAAETTPFESKEFHYAVALPAGCRHEEGPGTVDTICAPDFDPAKSALASNAAALVLSVAAEPMAGEGDSSIGALQERYGGAAFKEELPEAVCGEPDKARVKIENFSEIIDGPRLVYTADVVCAPVRFLQIGERRAAVRYVLTPDVRYRLMGRAQVEDFDRQRGTIDAFLASFRVLPGEKAER